MMVNDLPCEEGEGIVTKLAFIDLDGVIADSTARFQQAEEAKRGFLEMQTRFDALPETHAGREATNLYWKTAFDSSLVSLDTLIENADTHIGSFVSAGWTIIYLTSRPEQMRAATEAWLAQHDLYGPQLVMKLPTFQFVKTATWKADTVSELAKEAGDIVAIDDEELNLAAMQRRDGCYRLYSSLAEAAAKEVQLQ